MVQEHAGVFGVEGMKLEIRISRFDPQTDTGPRNQKFKITVARGETVLGALQQVYESQDSTLAFRFGCRFKGCGLCTIRINGRARLACTTRVEDGMELAPLDRFPIVRDLWVDRRPVTRFLTRHRLHLVPATERESISVFEVPPVYEELARCVECLACLSECPCFRLEDDGFGGPLTFVKIAMLHHDPRDTVDRRAQAAQLGIARCAVCEKHCRCPSGVPIYRAAIQAFL